jgi:flagellar hook assembly protein FlgD
MKKLFLILFSLAFFSVCGGNILLADDTMELSIEQNNPFNPSRNQTTQFVFSSRGHDRSVQVRVFTLSGELVRQWPAQEALKDTRYTQTWDGKNTDGHIVARGLYLVNLTDSGAARGITRRLAVIKQ